MRAYSRLVQSATVSASVPQLLIAGRGPDEAVLKALAGELGIADRVQWLGFQGNPMPYLKGAALLVLSSKYEGLPTVLIEAQALGVVTVSTDCPTGPREILHDGRAGMLVPVGDVPALFEALRRCLTDSALCEQYQREMVGSVQRFDARTVLPQFEALLDAVIVSGR